MMTMFNGVPIKKKDIASFCKKYGIRKFSLFGSIIRDDFHPGSDIDVLVEFEKDRNVSYFDIFDMEEDLSVIFDGRKVDIRTPEDLSRYFRNDIMKKAVIQYAS